MGLKAENVEKFEAQAAIVKALTDPKSEMNLEKLQARVDSDMNATVQVEADILNTVNSTLSRDGLGAPEKFAEIGEFVRNVSLEKHHPDYNPGWNLTLAVRTELMTSAGKN